MKSFKILLALFMIVHHVNSNVDVDIDVHQNVNVRCGNSGSEDCGSGDIGGIESFAGQPANCMDLLNSGTTQSGVYTIFPEGFSDGVEVFCDQTTDGGGWTVLLHRMNQSHQVDFARTFNEYAAGFGDPNTEYWIGNRVLASMTISDGPFSLYVEAVNIDGQTRYGLWNTFMVGSAFTWFTLKVGDYDAGFSSLGNGLSLTDDQANNRKFSTYDRDNDGNSGNCSGTMGNGGWWYGNCGGVNPTGPLGNENGLYDIAFWGYWNFSSPTDPWTPIALSEIQFQIRPHQ